MGLHVRDFREPSAQDGNAGNGGDIIKHSVYLALLDTLRAEDPWRGELHVVEAHAGKGVYIIPAKREYARVVKDDRVARASKLCAAQEMAFRCGLGSIDGVEANEQPYAASAVLHAFALCKLPKWSLLLMDADPDVTATARRVFNEPVFDSFCPRPRVQCTKLSSEEELQGRLGGSCFGRCHIIHLDPFAFVIGKEHAATRMQYVRLLRTANQCVARKRLAAHSVFFVWGRRHGSKAKADLDGVGCGVENGYQDLRAHVGSEQRITVEWCWGQYFAMLLAVPAEMRYNVIKCIRDYCEPFARRRMFRVF